MKVNSRSYTEDGYQPIPNIRLHDKEYGRALQRFIAVCADILPIDREKRLFYLALRTAKPLPGWWMIGGGIAAGTSKEEGAIANFERETTLLLPANRFELVAVNDYRSKDRAQSPQDIGCHTLGYTFAVELTPKELDSVNLDPSEYAANEGLKPHNRNQLIAASVHPAIVDLYDDLFTALQG